MVGVSPGRKTEETGDGGAMGRLRTMIVSDAKRAAMQVGKKKLLRELARSNISQVVVEYDGAGDSGQIDDVFTEPDDAGNQEITNQIEKFAYDVLECYWPGWEINDGSSGRLTISVEDQQVVLDHGVRYMEVESHRETI